MLLFRLQQVDAQKVAALNQSLDAVALERLKTREASKQSLLVALQTTSSWQSVTHRSSFTHRGASVYETLALHRTTQDHERATLLRLRERTALFLLLKTYEMFIIIVPE